MVKNPRSSLRLRAYGKDFLPIFRLKNFSVNCSLMFKTRSSEFLFVFCALSRLIHCLSSLHCNSQTCSQPARILEGGNSIPSPPRSRRGQGEESIRSLGLGFRLRHSALCASPLWFNSHSWLPRFLASLEISPSALFASAVKIFFPFFRLQKFSVTSVSSWCAKKARWF